jgi:hypothetical protein
MAREMGNLEIISCFRNSLWEEDVESARVAAYVIINKPEVRAMVRGGYELEMLSDLVEQSKLLKEQDFLVQLMFHGMTTPVCDRGPYVFKESYDGILLESFSIKLRKMRAQLVEDGYFSTQDQIQVAFEKETGRMIVSILQEE